MSCAYRIAATRIAAMAGIPLNLILTAMDIARQQRATFPALPPDRLPTITQLLGMNPTCGNPQQVIARAQSALIALGTLHPTHPCIERWMTIAAELGVPDDHLPVPVHPDVLATVCAQWAAPPPDPAPDRATAGIAALWQGAPIPAELIEEALRMGNRQDIVTWMAHGVWDDRFEAVCQKLTDAEIGIIVRAGVVPDALVEQVAQRLWSKVIPWEVFPLTLWDRVDDPDIARKGRACTAAAKLIRDPTLRDERLIDAAAQHPRSAAAILGKRHDLSDDRLIAAVAQDPWYARDVLVTRHDLSDDRLIAAVAAAVDVLDVSWICGVLIVRRDLSDDRLITTVAIQGRPSDVYRVLLARPDLRTDGRLLAAVARDRALIDSVLAWYPDLRDHPILVAALNATGSSG